MTKLLEKIEALLKLIEGLPLHDYAAPGAVHDVARKIADSAENAKHELLDDNTMVQAAEIVQLGMGLPGDHHYNYGHGILLREYDRDRLIRCLRSVVSGERGRPEKDEDEKMDQAFADRDAFEREMAAESKAGGKKGAKTRAYENLEKKWNLTNRRVRARVSDAFKLAPF
jgi:hypothetical protein